MEKKLRLLGLSTVIGAFAILSVNALGQALTRSGGGQSGGNAQVAAPSVGGQAHSNQIQHVLELCLNTRANLLIEEALEQGNQEIADRIVRADDTILLTLRCPEDQQKTIKDFWQVDKWKPNDKDWAEVIKAPSLVKELLNVDQRACDKAGLMEKQIWNDLTSDFQQVVARFEKDPAFASLSNQEKQDVLAKYQHDHPNPKSQVQRWKESVVRWDKLLNYTRTLLTQAQQAEFDGFVVRHSEAIKNAAAGLTPPVSR